MNNRILQFRAWDKHSKKMYLLRKTDRKPRASASGSAFSGYRKLLRMNDGQLNHP